MWYFCDINEIVTIIYMEIYIYLHLSKYFLKKILKVFAFSQIFCILIL